METDIYFSTEYHPLHIFLADTHPNLSIYKNALRKFV